MNSDQALQALMDGNQRFVSSLQNQSRLELIVQPEKMARDQTPFAIIVGCSDSRAPIELLFHQGFGDLFVIRVAGNIVTPTQLGSIEFACEKFGTPLIMVLGHTQCGAVSAAVNALQSEDTSQSDPKDKAASSNLIRIVEQILPAASHAFAATDNDQDEIITRATLANVNNSIANMTNQSELLRQLVNSGQVKIVGAVYDIASGKVELI